MASDVFSGSARLEVGGIGAKDWIAEEVEALKQRLGAIFPAVVDPSFSEYDAATNFYRSDPVHFKPDVGVRLLNREVLPYAARLVRDAPPGGQ